MMIEVCTHLIGLVTVIISFIPILNPERIIQVRICITTQVKKDPHQINPLRSMEMVVKVQEIPIIL